MKEVIIHIGTHKTGTSTIQNALKGYKDKNTRVASFKQENHSIPIFTIFSEHRYQYHIWNKKGLSRHLIDDLKAEYLEILEADLRDEQYDRLIISGEDISVLSSSEKHKLIEKIRSNGLKVKIIVFTRSPNTFACSSLQQHVKGGKKSWSPVNVDYQTRIGPFLDVVEKENIVVCDFDYVLENKLSLIDYFSEIAGINLHQTESENESVSVQALALIYKLNNVPLKVFGNAKRWKIRNQMVSKIIAMFPATSDFARLNPKYFSHYLSPTVKEDCLWLEDTFGISYSYNVDATESLSSYLEQSLVGCESQLAALFTSYGSIYNPQRSLEDNFMEAFIVYLLEEKGLLDSDADYLRDIADKITAKGELNTSDALMLMKLAMRARPTGPYIRKRVDKLSSALGIAVTQ